MIFQMGMTWMKSHLPGLAVAALLVIGPTLSGHAEDAAPREPAAPAAAQADAPPSSVPRPSLAPKAAEPESPETTTDTPPSPRHFAHRHYRRYGYITPRIGSRLRSTCRIFPPTGFIGIGSPGSSAADLDLPLAQIQ